MSDGVLLSETRAGQELAAAHPGQWRQTAAPKIGPLPSVLDDARKPVEPVESNDRIVLTNGHGHPKRDVTDHDDGAEIIDFGPRRRE